MTLTAKQENFCKAIVSGKTQTDSYREAYDVKRMSDKAITVECARLMKNPSIPLAIANLKKPITDKFNKSVEKLLQEYEDLILEAKTDKDRRIVMDAMKEQGKLLGYYEEVHKIKGDKENPLQTNITVQFTKSHKATEERIDEILNEAKSTTK